MGAPRSKSAAPPSRVPHISLAFREMWDLANVDLPLSHPDTVPPTKSMHRPYGRRATKRSLT
jgi:hypothetical protein